MGRAKQEVLCKVREGTGGMHRGLCSVCREVCKAFSATAGMCPWAVDSIVVTWGGGPNAVWTS